MPQLFALNVTIVHWRGPFKIEELGRIECSNGLYMVTGRAKYQKKAWVKYFGITEKSFKSRLTNGSHPTNQGIRPETKEIWIGQIVYPIGYTRDLLEWVEHCLIYIWQPPLNTAKKLVPFRPVCLINQWFHPEEPPVQRKMRPDVVKNQPDVMWYNNDMWRTGDLSDWHKR